MKDESGLASSGKQKRKGQGRDENEREEEVIGNEEKSRKPKRKARTENARG